MGPKTEASLQAGEGGGAVGGLLWNRDGVLPAMRTH